MAKSVRSGVVRGQGPPPGYRWGVSFVDSAEKEARSILNEAQHAHVVDLFRALAMEANPTTPATVSVDAVEDFWELRDKGGILGRINLRVFFAVDRPRREIVALCVVKKEADGQTPTWMKTRVRMRMRSLREQGWSV